MQSSLSRFPDYPNRSKLRGIHLKIKLGEYGSDLQFPRARAPEYSEERERAYLLSSEWVQELPRCSGRHIRFQAPESNRFDLPPWMIKSSRDLGYCALDLALRPDFARV